MHVDRRFLNWGIFFVLLGVVPLLVQAGVVDRDAVAKSWQLWPLLIVAAGIGLLLRHTSFEFAGGMVGAAIFGLMLGGVLAVGPDLGTFGRGCGNDAGRAFAAQQGTLTNGDVDVEFNCGDFIRDDRRRRFVVPRGHIDGG